MGIIDPNLEQYKPKSKLSPKPDEFYGDPSGLFQ